jgi:hypothetical protein
LLERAYRLALALQDRADPTLHVEPSSFARWAVTRELVELLDDARAALLHERDGSSPAQAMQAALCPEIRRSDIPARHGSPPE